MNTVENYVTTRCDKKNGAILGEYHPKASVLSSLQEWYYEGRSCKWAWSTAATQSLLKPSWYDFPFQRHFHAMFQKGINVDIPSSNPQVNPPRIVKAISIATATTSDNSVGKPQRAAERSRWLRTNPSIQWRWIFGRKSARSSLYEDKHRRYERTEN